MEWGSDRVFSHLSGLVWAGLDQEGRLKRPTTTFLAKHFTTEIDGEAVPYSLSESTRVCSSCAEFFNLASPDSRKLVRSCPGAVTFAKAPSDVYVDVRPVKGRVAESLREQSD